MILIAESRKKIIHLLPPKFGAPHSLSVCGNINVQLHVQYFAQRKEGKARQRKGEAPIVFPCCADQQVAETMCWCWCKPASSQGKEEILDRIGTLWSHILLRAFESKLAFCLKKYIGKS